VNISRNFLILLVLCLSPLLNSCSAPNNVIPNPYYQGSPVYPYLIQASVNRLTQDGTQGIPWAQVTLNLESMPVSNASVTLIATNGSGPVTVPVVYNSSYTYYYNTAVNGGVTTWVYQPGQVYTVQVCILGTVYSASVTAPGGISVPLPSTGSPVSWSVTGNQNSASVTEQFVPYSTTFQAPINSTSPNPSSPLTLTGAYPVSGSYGVSITCAQVNSPGFSNTYTGSYMAANDVDEETETK